MNTPPAAGEGLRRLDIGSAPYAEGTVMLNAPAALASGLTSAFGLNPANRGDEMATARREAVAVGRQLDSFRRIVIDDAIERLHPWE